jgi:hypothetical protein
MARVERLLSKTYSRVAAINRVLNTPKATPKVAQAPQRNDTPAPPVKRTWETQPWLHNHHSPHRRRDKTPFTSHQATTAFYPIPTQQRFTHAHQPFTAIHNNVPMQRYGAHPFQAPRVVDSTPRTAYAHAQYVAQPRVHYLAQQRGPVFSQSSGAAAQGASVPRAIPEPQVYADKRGFDKPPAPSKTSIAFLLSNDNE